jgi:hypothetical protein
MEAAKPNIMKRQLDLLAERYDLSDRRSVGVVMSLGKPVQDGVRAKLPAGTTWDQLATMTPEEVKHYTDNLVHNLQTERFFKSRVINNHTAIGDGSIKTFPLRGIKDTPPYLHDGRLLTLDDTVEFFNLILELKLSEQEKRDLVAFMRQL